MPYRIVKVFTAHDINEQLDDLRTKDHIVDFWESSLRERKSIFFILCRTENTQKLTDILTPMAEKEERPNIVIMPVQAALPVPSTDDEKPKEKGRGKDILSREELYETVRRGARLDANFLWLVIFSAIVAAIGVLQNNVAVIIGAMVIAPLLGPNLALALGSTLGDRELWLQAVKTSVVGLGAAVLLSYIFGLLWPGDPYSTELLARTEVGLDGVAIAIVSGAAGVLSLTTGVSSVLVGVMVAVALMPPAVVVGIMAGHADWTSAEGALLLLAINIVCINLTAKLVFWFKGVEPRTWYKKQEVKGHMRRQILSWTIALAILIALIFLKKATSY